VKTGQEQNGNKTGTKREQNDNGAWNKTGTKRERHFCHTVANLQHCGQSATLPIFAALHHLLHCTICCTAPFAALHHLLHCTICCTAIWHEIFPAIWHEIFLIILANWHGFCQTMRRKHVCANCRRIDKLA